MGVVPSADWKPILERFRWIRTAQPLVFLERHQTFFEDVLLVHEPKRQKELMSKWGAGLDQLLALAVTHELGHALCNDPDERRADRFGQKLREMHQASCERQ